VEVQPSVSQDPSPQVGGGMTAAQRKKVIENLDKLISLYEEIVKTDEYVPSGEEHAPEFPRWSKS
jgi:hypothetical protein